MKRLLLLPLLAALLAQAVAAAPPTIDLVARKLGASAASDGATSAETLRPGETLEYELRWTNNDAAPVRDVALTLPVPAGKLVYVAAGDLPPPDLASLDGVRFEPLPLMRAEVGADGRRHMRPVPLAEYRFLRWNLGELAGHTHRSVRARMQMPPVR